MLTIQHLSYIHPDKEALFSDLNLTVGKHDKIALIGNNGSGKSTFLRILAQELHPSGGQICRAATPYFIPQIFGQFNHLTVAQALRVADKLCALKAILNGETSEANFAALQDDWTIEERCHEALQGWGLAGLDLSQPMETLSGGQKTKVFLAGIAIHQAALVLLDEPSNHLDLAGRQLLYDFVQSTKSALLVVSHDRKLLNLLPMVCELGKDGLQMYGGNYDFYRAQKQIEEQARAEDVQSAEKALKKARQKERETTERQQKLDSRGKGKQEKAGVARIMMNTLRNSAENSTAKLKSVHTEKIGALQQQLQDLRAALPETDQMKFGFDNALLHKGKNLFGAEGINIRLKDGSFLWSQNLSLQIVSGERIALKGANGSGKTTLVKVVLGDLLPQVGKVVRAESRAVYVDQEYSLIRNNLTVYEQAQAFNAAALPEHEVKIRLVRFLFLKEDWDKPCSALSGGERMRLMLCCLGLGGQAPDIIILDEPTNNLDLQNIDILTGAINDYEGTLLVISHDETFLNSIHTERTVLL